MFIINALNIMLRGFYIMLLDFENVEPGLGLVFSYLFVTFSFIIILFPCAVGSIFSIRLRLMNGCRQKWFRI